MLEFISGVSEEVLKDKEVEVAFKVTIEGVLVSTVRSNGRDAQHTIPLNRASSRLQGNAVGSNLLASL